MRLTRNRHVRCKRPRRRLIHLKWQVVPWHTTCAADVRQLSVQRLLERVSMLDVAVVDLRPSKTAKLNEMEVSHQATSANFEGVWRASSLVETDLDSSDQWK